MEAKAVKQLASGRWASIVSSLSPHLNQAVEKMGHHVACPVHGGVDGFRVFKNFEETGGGVCNTCGVHHDGYSLLMWVNGWDFKTTHQEIQRALGITADTQRALIVQPLPKPKAKEKDAQAIRDTLNHVWKSSVALTEDIARPARRYFANRGIHHVDYRKLDSNVIRFVPLLEYYEEGKLAGKYPTIVTMICDASGCPAAIHRTYLTHEGTKAPIQSPKKIMRHCAENLFGAMRIAVQGKGKVLAVTEGIETALAVMGAFNVPVWVAGNAYLLENFVPPKGCAVVIYADKDRPSNLHPEGHGYSAAKSLLKRLWEQGIHAGIKLPTEDIPQWMKSVDWLDVLNGSLLNTANNQVKKLPLARV